IDFASVDIRADIYSLGCTLYYLLTGRPTFPDCTLAEKLLRHQRAEPTPVEQQRNDIPASLGPVLRKMMAKKPEDRFQTPREVASALAAPTATYLPVVASPRDAIPVPVRSVAPAPPVVIVVDPPRDSSPTVWKRLIVRLKLLRTPQRPGG